MARPQLHHRQGQSEPGELEVPAPRGVHVFSGQADGVWRRLPLGLSVHQVKRVRIDRGGEGGL